MSGNNVIAGTITCTPDDLEMVLREIAVHVSPSCQEPGCLAHGLRTKASTWWSSTRQVPTDLTISEQ